MVQKITWSPEALKTFLDTISYLKENWTEKEIANFTERVDEKLSVMQHHPRLGSIKNRKLNIHKTIVHKKIILIYKYKPLKKEVILLSFWDTLRDPQKMAY